MKTTAEWRSKRSASGLQSFSLPPSLHVCPHPLICLRERVLLPAVQAEAGEGEREREEVEEEKERGWKCQCHSATATASQRYCEQDASLSPVVPITLK